MHLCAIIFTTPINNSRPHLVYSGVEAESLDFMIPASFYLNNSLFIYKFHLIFMIHFSLFSPSFQNNFLPVSVVFRLHGGCAFSSICAGSLPAKSTFPNGDFASGEFMPETDVKYFL